MAKSKSKELVPSWQQELAKFSKEGKAPKEKALAGDWISLKGGRFSLGGVKIGNELDCVIVGWNFEKVRYDGDYVEGETSSPACQALGYDEDTLVPFDASPNKQNDDCASCWANEWGSNEDGGKGKACADRRHLALVVAGKGDKMELKGLNIPPTSLKNWKEFINEIETLGLQPMQCAVNIHFDEDSTAAQAPLIFEFVKEIVTDKALNLTASMLEPASKLIELPANFDNYNKALKGKGKKAIKKKTSKKKSKKKSKFG